MSGKYRVSEILNRKLMLNNYFLLDFLIHNGHSYQTKWEIYLLRKPIKKIIFAKLDALRINRPNCYLWMQG